MYCILPETLSKSTCMYSISLEWLTKILWINFSTFSVFLPIKILDWFDGKSRKSADFDENLIYEIEHTVWKEQEIHCNTISCQVWILRIFTTNPMLFQQKFRQSNIFSHSTKKLKSEISVTGVRVRKKWCLGTWR